MNRDFIIFSNTFKNAMKDGPPILLLETNDGNEAFCRRRRGEEINDPDCEDIYQAQASGVYQRAVRMRGEKKDYIWLFACDGDEYSIDSFLKHRYMDRSELELAGMTVQAAFQIAKHKDPSLGRRPTGMF